MTYIRLFFAAAILILILGLAAAAFYYRGNAIAARSETALVRADLSSAVSINKDNQAALARLQADKAASIIDRINIGRSTKGLEALKWMDAYARELTHRRIALRYPLKPTRGRLKSPDCCSPAPRSCRRRLRPCCMGRLRSCSSCSCVRGRNCLGRGTYSCASETRCIRRAF